jgi:GT2 family glycosyltransferase
MADPYIDIILLSYQKYHTTTRLCLDSILPDMSSETLRLTVIDNGSPDGSGDRIALDLADKSNVRVIALSNNLGFAGGMNYGASIATGEWLLLLNSDTTFQAGSLSDMADVLMSQPFDIGLVGPITNNAGTAQGYDLCGGASEWQELKTSVKQSPTRLLVPAYRLDFFCVAIRRSVWERLGGLDTNYGLGYYEDFDFSLRAAAIGVKIGITEDVFVCHAGGESFSTQNDVAKLIKKNKLILRNKLPNTIFLHKRQDNYRVLRFYSELRLNKEWSPALELRARFRVKSLWNSLPKGWFKKLLWILRILFVSRKLNLPFNGS